MSDTIKDLYTKKKKSKPKAKSIGNIRIVDDDVSVRDLAPDNLGNTLEDDLYVDEPVVAEIIDERPEIVKKLEHYTNSKWKRIVNDEDDEIRKYEEMIANQDINEKPNVPKRSVVIDDDDDDLDILRIKKMKDNSHKKTDSVKDIKIKKEKEDEVDETKVRVKRKTEEEKMKEARKEERKAQYAEWGKGLVQKKLRQEKLESDLHEAEKPLARYIDDQDLDKILREKELEDDPMLEYIKKSKKGEDGVEKKAYKGPAPAPNRYNIQPGYRWDGVDRSNGFEKKYFESLTHKKAIEVESYKWSVEDM